MPLESIAEGVLHFAGRIVAYLVVDILLDIVFSLSGKVFLRTVTLGHYPPSDNGDYSELFVQVVGFLVVIALSIATIHLLDFGTGW